MKRSLLPLLFIALVIHAPLLAEDSPNSPYHLPTPEGWRTEIIPFPLSFAPELKYEGLEELRFAPGMFDAQKDDFWSYLFIWWIRSDSKIEAPILATDLVAYFRGLSLGVAKQGNFEPQDPVFEAEVDEPPTKPGHHRIFHGKVETLDAFVTRKSVHLGVRAEVMPCPDQDRMAVIFELSPQPSSHTVWQTMAKIRQGFRCQAE